ncbi:MAG: type II secretion system protein M [Deltaproteobacteria bacterium]|nr:type II secretion system protein M [Deltaproteobacteria bacterium]
MKNWLTLALTSLRERVKLPDQLRSVVVDATAGFAARLSPRERWLVVFAGIALVGICFSLFVVAPLLDARERLQAKVVAKERELSEVATLDQSYEALRHELEVVGSANGSTLSPFAFLEGLTTSTLGREKLAAINPIGHEDRGGLARETIELKLSGVSLQELVDLLYKIDVTGTTLRCTNLAIKKRYKDPYTFDVTLTAIALNTR